MVETCSPATHTPKQDQDLESVATRLLQVSLHHLQYGAELELGDPVVLRDIFSDQKRSVLGTDRGVILILGDGQTSSGIGRIREERLRLP